ncbi:MAG: Rne/Rng family ribonuclease [Candidatus Omnitrophica bacterium]|nr:Rne/Rng family ribonuclease [Candidatus Omnitrophota bacterium]
MKKEILISYDANEKQVAILEDGRLEEFYIERNDAQRLFGNIYKGKVKTVIPGIGAAFVDLGTRKDGFLYVADALRSPFDMDAEFDENAPAPQEDKRKERFKRIDEVLKVGQEVIVQVVKEPIRNKGPRLTTHFSIPARYLVMIPGEEKVGVSRRIEDRKERERIRNIFKSMELPKGAGFIVRTAGEGKSDKEFARDIRYLVRSWKKIHGSMAQSKAPSTIHQELDLVERVIRDHFTEDTDSIVVDHKDIYRKVQRFFNLYLPGYKANLISHEDRVPIFEKYNIEKEIEGTFQRDVFLKSGGHIVIEQTEGLVAIDVNTGKFTGTKNLEETVYKTNMEAAWEVARQLRLRDVGGIIIIDFIDMERGEHRRSLYKTFKEAVRRDRAKTNILQMSELGLVEMTRQRIRPSLESAVYNTCPYCEGKGMIKSSATMSIQTIRELRKALGHSHGRIINAGVHPEVAERLLHQEKKAIHQLERHSRSRIFVFSDPALHREELNITFVK